MQFLETIIRGGKMKKIKGPAIFLAQFVGEEAPFNSLDNICKWASSLGYKGVQIPSWDSRLIDLKKASESKDYCDEIKSITKSHNIEITCLLYTSPSPRDS